MRWFQIGIGIGIAVTAIVILLSNLLFPSKCGAIVLVGGGKIPEDAIIWLKQRALSNHYLVITCNRESGEFAKDDPNFTNLTNHQNNRWVKMLKAVKFVLPEDFSKTSLFGIGAIIIDGGDQWQYINRLSGNAIQNAHESGIPIMGTSAGAMILGEYYFTAENGTISSEEACNNNVNIGRRFVTIECLKGLIVDTHFQERSRNGRLKIFIEKSGASYGLGIDEETALCIDNRESLILGKGGIKFIANSFAK